MLSGNIRSLIKISGLLSIIILLVYGYINHKYINQISGTYNKILKTSLENTTSIQTIARNSAFRLVELNGLLNTNSIIPQQKRIDAVHNLIHKNDTYYEALGLMPLTDKQRLNFNDLTAFRKKCLVHTDSFINIIKTGNFTAASSYFDTILLPDEQLYSGKQISLATSFRDEAYSNAIEVESISAKVSFLNILITFMILLFIIISILYLILLVISFFKESHWTGITGDNVSIINK